jgi:sec-independent protein translocase protein TatA
MGTFSIWHWLILLVVVLVLFGGSNKISNMMGDVAKGIKSFKRGLQDEDAKPEDSTLRTLDHDAQPPLKTEVKREAQG